jgi:hypothetical protein
MTKRSKIKPNDKKEVAEKKQHELTVREGEALRSYISRLDEKTAPTVTVSKDGKEISIDHPNKKIGFPLLVEALGTTNADFAIDIIVDLMDASQENLQFNPSKFKAMLSTVIDTKPRNQSDAQLAVHKAVTHLAIMKTARQMATAENLMQQESAQRMFSRLNQTYNELDVALKRGRAAAEHTFTVQQNVNVADGGQAAVVTNVSHAQSAPADVQNESLAASPLALSDARATPMPIINDGTTRAVMPEPIQRFRPKLIK